MLSPQARWMYHLDAPGRENGSNLTDQEFEGNRQTGHRAMRCTWKDHGRTACSTIGCAACARSATPVIRMLVG
jgi:hypothetical protein